MQRILGSLGVLTAYMLKDLSLIPSMHIRAGTAMNLCNPGARQTETGRPQGLIDQVVYPNMASFGFSGGSSLVKKKK